MQSDLFKLSLKKTNYRGKKAGCQKKSLTGAVRAN